MLRWRLVSAAALITAFLLLFWADVRLPLLGVPGLLLVPLVGLLAVLAAAELLDLLAGQHHQLNKPLIYAGTLLVALTPCAPMLWALSGRTYPRDCPLGRTGWPLVALALALLATFTVEMRRFRSPGQAVMRMAISMWIMTYIGLSLAFLVLLRLQHGQLLGMLALLSMIVVVKMADTGAYFTGRALGRHKMAPTISPGKTWEGTAGGLIAACLSAWLFLDLLIPRLVPTFELSLAAIICYGLLVAVAGILGDLGESLIKRDTGRKDSSNYLPGMGGLLDVLDSIFLAAMPAWVFWTVAVAS